MHTPFYRHVLRDAWQVTWRNKALWILGLLGAIWGVSGLQLMSSYWRTIMDRAMGNYVLSGSMGRFSHIALGHLSFGAIAGFVTLVALAGLLLWVITAARGGIYWTLWHAGKVPANETTVSKGLHAGTKRFWPLLLLHVLARLFIAAVLIGMSCLLVMARNQSPWVHTLVVLFAAALTLLIALFSTMVVFSGVSMMAHNLSLRAALGRAWKTLSRHWVVVIEMVVLLYCMSTAAGLVLLIGAVMIATPLLVLFAMTSIISGALGFWLIGLPLILLALALLLTTAAWYATFESAAWVSLYRRTEEASPVPKLYRLIAHVRARLKQ